jgi:uncharacterized hydrophobic protein (TIGR00271 family)
MQFTKDGHFTIPFFETTTEEREQVYNEVRDNHQMRPSYLAMLILACLVATLGLLSNSTAVVIGAMLISPLMNPFLSAGLALAVGDWDLGKAALRTIGLSILAALAISALTVWLSPLKETNSEVLSRTNPNLLDLGIAFFSGCAGTYTLISRKGLTTIPGVAIATAVMPPLCVVGFGIQHLDGRIIIGAGSLFLTNLAAIVISAATVFLLASFRATELPGRHWAASTRISISFVVLAVLAIPLAMALLKAADNSRMRQQVEKAVRAEIESDPGRARINSGLTFAEIEGKLAIEATIRTTRYFSHTEVGEMTRSLEKNFGRPVVLELDQVMVKHGGLADVIPVSPVSPKVTEVEALNRLADTYRKDVELAVSVLGGKLDRFFITTDGQNVIRVEILATIGSFPEESLQEAARRVFEGPGTKTGAPKGPPLVFRLRPGARIEIRPEDLVSGRRPSSTPVSTALIQPRAFLRADPEMVVALETDSAFTEIEVGKLTADLATALGISPERIIKTADTGNLRALSILLIRKVA